MEKGHVYAVENFPNSVEKITEHLGEPLAHWVADKATFDVASGIPSEWREQGALFGPMGELRWWREGDRYRALLLTEAQVEDSHSRLHLVSVPGNWMQERQEVNLQNLMEPRVNPKFTRYPHGNPEGRLEVRLYYGNGVPTFVSLRRFVEGEEAG